MKTNSKVLALLSGGLDSTLAVKIMLEHGFDVEAVNFTTPFCLCDVCAVDSVSKKFGIKVHRLFLGQEFLDLVVDPPHGYGSQMNPCIDCRILMLRKAGEMAQHIGAPCIVTGEVLNERPFSQRKDMILLIERAAGLEGKILRPLSAKLLPPTELEKKGVVKRERLYAIQGRRRLPQIHLAQEWGIQDYPCPSGGCLLTDPQFTKRLRDLFKHTNKVTLFDIGLLKLGRHFRMNECKLIVGRNQTENHKLLSIAKQAHLAYLEVIDHMSPITLIRGKSTQSIIQMAAAITVRYSDAPTGIETTVRYAGKSIRTLTAKGADNQEIEQLRI